MKDLFKNLNEKAASKPTLLDDEIFEVEGGGCSGGTCSKSCGQSCKVTCISTETQHKLD